MQWRCVAFDRSIFADHDGVGALPFFCQGPRRRIVSIVRQKNSRPKRYRIGRRTTLPTRSLFPTCRNKLERVSSQIAMRGWKETYTCHKHAVIQFVRRIHQHDNGSRRDWIPNNIELNGGKTRHPQTHTIKTLLFGRNNVNNDATAALIDWFISFLT